MVVSSRPSYGSGTVKPSKEIEAAVEPVLDAMLAVSRHDSQATEAELGKRLEKILDDRSSTADESLVVLLSFYVGEANSGDVLHQITIRGKRMLSLLARYEDRTVILEHGARFDKIRMPLGIRRQNFTTAIKFIRKGKVWGTG